MLQGSFSLLYNGIGFFVSGIDTICLTKISPTALPWPMAPPSFYKLGRKLPLIFDMIGDLVCPLNPTKIKSSAKCVFCLLVYLFACLFVFCLFVFSLLAALFVVHSKKVGYFSNKTGEHDAPIGSDLSIR